MNFPLQSGRVPNSTRAADEGVATEDFILNEDAMHNNVPKRVISTWYLCGLVS